jgi:hypothetical protein
MIPQSGSIVPSGLRNDNFVVSCAVTEQGRGERIRIHQFGLVSVHR